MISHLPGEGVGVGILRPKVEAVVRNRCTHRAEKKWRLYPLDFEFRGVKNSEHNLQWMPE